VGDDGRDSGLAPYVTKEDLMRRLVRAFAFLAALVAVTWATIPAGLGASTPPTTWDAKPLWVTHVENYPGGISGTARAVAAPEAKAPAKAASGPRPAHNPGANVQMNDDSYPPLPQNETAVAYNVDRPQVAVAAANDYVGGGVVVMRTSDSGKNLASTRITPQFFRTRDFCSGGGPRGAVTRGGRAVYHNARWLLPGWAIYEVQG
jgi:hypothetical protein